MYDQRQYSALHRQMIYRNTHRSAHTEGHKNRITMDAGSSDQVLVPREKPASIRLDREKKRPRAKNKPLL